jgi:transposase
VTKDMMIGVDLAKHVFQLHGASMTGHVKFRKRLSRAQFHKFMTEQAPSVVVMEACGGAHFWARQMINLGHEVKLISPRYVKPFLKRQKNDAADAEAIVDAAQRPEMRFVEIKTEAQQTRTVLFRNREQLVHQRTELTNALRAHLYEYGYIAPQGRPGIKQIHDMLYQERSDLPELVRDLCRDMLKQIAEKTARIQAMLVRLKELATETETANRLQTMPGVGPITALAIEAFAPPMETFRSGRDFAAWLGLVPRQHSSGGNQRLGRTSKAGQVDIRKLLIIGAMSRLSWLGRKSISEGSWLARMLVRKPRMLVAVALANKMARAIWAMLTKKESYRDPALTAAA